ncbi:MAG TPA: methyltransferase [Tepidisphaeraceae bacterium]|nr:methyltransferase [Tepidisphaeraceae bacterium]
MTDRRDALLHRIHRHYPTVTRTLRFGGVTIEFTRIADADRVLDDVAAEADRRSRQRDVKTDDPLRMPYWAELWESSTAIAEYLARGPSLHNRRVLDLGCGMGLAGAAAAAQGAAVLLADIEPLALLLARLNTLPWHDRVRIRRLNWQIDRLPEKFDLILGADILYERPQWEYLDAFWTHHLAPGGQILLGEPGRQTGDAFGPWIAQRRWSAEQFAHPMPGSQKSIRMFRLTI